MINCLYYSIFKFIQITPSSDEQPQYISNIVLSVILSFDLIFLFTYLNKEELIDYKRYDNPLGFISIYVLFFILIHFLIVKNDRFKEIIESWDSKSLTYRVMCHSFTLGLIGLTLVLIVQKY